MTFRAYITVMVVASIAAWGAVVGILVRVNPFAAGFLSILLLYVSIFLAVTGTLALLGILVRRRFFAHEEQSAHVAIAFRQAVWFGVLVDGSLVLARYGLLTWWTLAFFIVFLTVIEASALALAGRRS